MRQLVMAAALPLVLACAQQSATLHSDIPDDGSLRVELRAPRGQTLEYVLNGPAHVAIFAVTQSGTLNLLFPYSLEQIDRPMKAGMNRLSQSGASGRAYYIIASKSPLPVHAIVQSPELLRRLVGEEAFRGANPAVTWDALDAIMAKGLPDRAWASTSQLFKASQQASSRVARWDVVRCTGGRVPSNGGCWRPPSR